MILQCAQNFCNIFVSHALMYMHLMHFCNFSPAYMLWCSLCARFEIFFLCSHTHSFLSFLHRVSFYFCALFACGHFTSDFPTWGMRIPSTTDPGSYLCSVLLPTDWLLDTHTKEGCEEVAHGFLQTLTVLIGPQKFRLIKTALASHISARSHNLEYKEK